jgi:hypothetical protein
MIFHLLVNVTEAYKAGLLAPDADPVAAVDDNKSDGDGNGNAGPREGSSREEDDGCSGTGGGGAKGHWHTHGVEATASKYKVDRSQIDIGI